MNIRILRFNQCVFALLLLVAAFPASAQDWKPEMHLSGVINDYTPLSVKPTGPWEVRGPWSLIVNRETGTADFSAALTMELSDYSQNATTVDAPGARSQHTHHIAVVGGTVTSLATGGFEVMGPVTITKDGSPAPLAASTAVIDITGGTDVEFSNITVTFKGGAPVHFGAQAIHGVVRHVRSGRHDDER
jgi:hypothetical protein